MTSALDLFAGPGGWSLACRELGIDETGIDTSTPACATARAAGHTRVQADVTTYPIPTVGNHDGLIASPPCQTFSTAGKGTGRRSLDVLLAAVPLVGMGLDPTDAIGQARGDAWLWGTPDDLDERSALVLEPLRYARTMRPTWFALEQVPDVLPVWEAYARVLRGWGYHAATRILSAECYGVPQTRKRAILVAHRDRPVMLPAATHSRYHGNATRLDRGVLPWVSMADALGWGMTARPYVTVAAGTTSGGPDSSALGGSGARASVDRELDAGRWAYRNDVPAPTVHTMTSKATTVVRATDNLEGWVRERPSTCPVP